MTPQLGCAIRQRSDKPIEILLVSRLNNRFDSLCDVRIIKHLHPLQMRAVIKGRELHAQRKKWFAVMTNHNT